MNSKFRSILVVDDSATMRQLIKMTVQQSLRPALVVEAEDGRRALERYDSGNVDLVITDINMPTMDGLELIRNLRAQGSTVPIVIVTTRGAEKEREEGLQLGANSYITKPINGANLIHAINEINH